MDESSNNTSNIQMLRQGQRPSTSEAISIRSLLADTINELAKIDKEVDQTREVLRQLTSKRDILRTRADEHAALFAPVRGLPLEVLGEIFNLCLPKAPTQQRDFEICKGFWYFPLRLTHVSHLWRSVCLSIPRLWTTIVIIIDKDSSVDRIISALQAWLLRSGNRPLLLMVSIEDFETVESFLPALELVMAHSDRWEDILFNMPLSFHRALNPIRGRLPLLKAVRLLDWNNEDFTNLLETDIYEETPQLREVNLVGGFNRVIRSLPWHQLTTLDCDQSNDFFSLRHAHNVVTCTFFDMRLGLDPQPIAPATFIPPLQYLTTLQIVVCNTISMGHTLPLLFLPALYSLDLIRAETGGSDQMWPQLECHDFFQRVSNLRELRFDVPVMANDLVQCLALLPMLAKLRVYPNSGTQNPLTDELIQNLYYGPTRAFPRLTNMHFGGNVQFSGDALLAMIDSRFNNEAHRKDINKGEADELDIIILDYDVQSPEPNLVEALQDLDEEGLVVWLTDHNKKLIS